MIRRETKLLTGSIGASFSECQRYRYSLWRIWDTGPLLNFLMLNPSTADDIQNDPTVERCKRRAERLNYGGLIVTNLFAFRATDPKAMKAEADPIGPLNDDAIRESASQCKAVVCAWGNHGKHRNRACDVRAMLAGFCSSKLYILRITTGEPWHPLYLPYDLPLTPWEPN